MASQAARAREVERHRNRYHRDPEFRERIKASGRRSSQKMHDELVANPKDPRHGTVTGYFKGLCKCRECKDAMNDYYRDLRKPPPRKRRRFQWSAEIQARLNVRDDTMRRMAQEGCRIEQAASAIGIRVDSAGRLAAKLGLSRQFHENRLPKVCREGHAYERDARGRRVCRACIQKANITQRQRRYREGLPVGDLRHGTSNGYRNWGCRCDQCKAAGAVDNKQTRERRKEAAR